MHRFLLSTKIRYTEWTLFIIFCCFKFSFHYFIIFIIFAMINNCTFFFLITNVPLNLHKNNNNFNLCVNSSWYSIFEKKVIKYSTIVFGSILYESLSSYKWKIAQICSNLPRRYPNSLKANFPRPTQELMKPTESSLTSIQANPGFKARLPILLASWKRPRAVLVNWPRRNLLLLLSWMRLNAQLKRNQEYVTYYKWFKFFILFPGNFFYLQCYTGIL